MVKALDLKSNGIFPRRFEPYSQRLFSHNRIMRFSIKFPEQPPRLAVPANLSCDGRVVKAFDSKSNGIFPRRFESYSQRCSFEIILLPARKFLRACHKECRSFDYLLLPVAALQLLAKNEYMRRICTSVFRSAHFKLFDKIHKLRWPSG